MYVNPDDIRASIQECRRGIANAKTRGDRASLAYFIDKLGEHRREFQWVERRPQPAPLTGWHPAALDLYALQARAAEANPNAPRLLPTAFLPWDVLERGWGRAT